MSLFAVPLGTNNGASGLYMTDTEIGQQNQSFAKTCKTPNNHGFFHLFHKFQVSSLTLSIFVAVSAHSPWAPTQGMVMLSGSLGAMDGTPAAKSSSGGSSSWNNFGIE